MTRLRRADCAGPGFRRRRQGRGFVYLDENGTRISDASLLERLRGLVIPPAWKDVWICPWPNGHLQAVGTDAAGRRQYLYHPAWRERRDQEKFDRMLAFARALPLGRAAASRHLAQPELTRNRVLACAFRLLDVGFFRVGGEVYAEENETFGLATLRKEHVTVDGNTVIFEYPAKNGSERLQSVVDPDVGDVVRALKRRRRGGAELLAYKGGNRWRDVRSSDINEYVKEILGGDFSAKDFRTWHATVLATVALGVSAQLSSATARTRAVRRAYQEVSHYLGNTPAVSRRAYVDPRVVDRFRGGFTIADVFDAPREAIEAAVIDLIEERTPIAQAA